jgi:hypothetical protein
MVIATKSETFLLVLDSLLIIDMIRLACQSVENPSATMIGSAKSTSAILFLLFWPHYHWEAFLADASVLESITPVHAKRNNFKLSHLANVAQMKAIPIHLRPSWHVACKYIA